LKLIIDRNRFQSLGRTEDIVPLEPLKQKWEAFGWKTIEVDGHDLDEIVEALTEQTEGPVCVIAHTIKGHGVDFMEDKLEWHYRSPNPEQLIEAKSQFRNKSIT
jgi:transketolase